MHLSVTADSTTLSYWLNWGVFLCFLIVLTPIFVALFLIWKYESFGKVNCDGRVNVEDIRCDVLYDDDVWRPCFQEIHPIWLLVYRVVAFCLALVTFISKSVASGGAIFFYYTHWTFTLVTIYFGFGTLLSIYGCCQLQKISCCDCSNAQGVRIDTEQGYYVSLTTREDTSELRKHLYPQEKCSVSRAEGFISFLFQVIFQMNAGAVMLTDFIYWTILFPFLTIKDYSMNFMTVNMHTLNAILLLGDTALNCLRFPWFRISYFILWTGAYVIFQWIIHACLDTWWPYPFLDLSSPYAPLWYSFVAVMHLPCYGMFVLIEKTKHHLLSKWFPQSYRFGF